MGGYTDAETGLYLLGHRYYDPNTGRFLTRDPLGYAGGINLYAYCGNDPVNRADPSGLHDLDWLPDGAGTNITTIPGTVPPSVVDNMQAEDNAEDCGAGDGMGGGGTGPSAVPPENRIVLSLREDLENFRQFIGGPLGSRAD